MKSASGQEWTTLETIDCVICGRDETKLVFAAHDFIYGNEGTFPIVECRTCGLVYVNPRPSKEESSKFYPTTYFSYQPWVVEPKDGLYAQVRRTLKTIVLEEGLSYPRRPDALPSILTHSFVRRSLARIFARYVQSTKVPPFLGNHRILDVGCGNGAFLLEMRKLGWDAYGVELNPVIANHARTRLGLNVSSGTLEHTKLPDGFFDVITFWDTLEHFPNPLEVLAETSRILSPTGMLIIDTPNFDCVPRRLFRQKWFNLAAPLHYYFYTRETLDRLLGRAGFYIDKVRYPLGTAGLRESLEIVMLGRLEHNGSTARRILRSMFYVPHRLTPRGHLVAYAKRKSPQMKPDASPHVFRDPLAVPLHGETRLDHKKYYRRHFDERVASNLGAYQGERPSFLGHGYKKRRDICLEWLQESHFAPGSKVLDAGCGASPLVQLLTELGYKAWGLDHSFKMLQDAHAEPKGRFAQGDIEALPYPDEAFDAVICLGVLDYLPSDDIALRELSRVTRRGGVLMVSLPQKINVPAVVEFALYVHKKLGLRFGRDTVLSRAIARSRSRWPTLQRRERSFELLREVGFVPQKSRPVRFAPMTFIGRALFSERMTIRASRFLEALHPIPGIAAFADWCLVKARRNE